MAPFFEQDEDDKRGCGGGFRGIFGRHRGGPFARMRGARLFDSGALRLVALGLIGEEPRHGYEIIKALRTSFQGAYAPSPGAIYPLLQLLEDAGLVSSQMRGPRRRFTITEQGREYLAQHRQELIEILRQVRQAAEPIRESAIGEAIGEFRNALFQKMRKGQLTAEQANKLRDVLRKAREEIENL